MDNPWIWAAIVVGAVLIIGIAWNARDIARYIRISTM
jgi:hypothetical protein